MLEVFVVIKSLSPFSENSIPVHSTPGSFSSSILSEHSLRSDIESTSILLSTATASSFSFGWTATEILIFETEFISQILGDKIDQSHQVVQTQIFWKFHTFGSAGPKYECFCPWSLWWFEFLRSQCWLLLCYCLKGLNNLNWIKNEKSNFQKD